ncbi:MAG TPA: ABC transporter permease [Acidobacteriota bacterium]|jgi:ABC-type polysaccharide/polyol phosphate export permease|nr:ABC transporter permease [Acidobacteriota bacterium]
MTSNQFLQISTNFISKLIHHRYLIWNFAMRELKQRYVGSFMGLFWAVVHPLILLVSYTFVFSVIFKADRRWGLGNYPVFLFCGILPWLFFQDTVLRSTNSILEHAHLIKKTLFPSEILPLAILVANLLNHAVGFLILLGVLLWQRTVGWPILLLPLFLAGLILFTAGLSWIAAALNVFMRDTAQMLSVILTFWFWFTPIFYLPAMVPSRFRPWLAMNPLTHVVEAYRQMLLFDRIPTWQSAAILYAFGASIFILGGVFFRVSKREFADVI